MVKTLVTKVRLLLVTNRQHWLLDFVQAEHHMTVLCLEAVFLLSLTNLYSDVNFSVTCLLKTH